MSATKKDDIDVLQELLRLSEHCKVLDMNELQFCKPVVQVQVVQTKVTLEEGVNKENSLSDVLLSPRFFVPLLKQC